MPVYREEGDAIEGERIVCQAREISKPTLVQGSSRHKKQQITLKGRQNNLAKCWIVKPRRLKRGI